MPGSAASPTILPLPVEVAAIDAFGEVSAIIVGGVHDALVA